MMLYFHIQDISNKSVKVIEEVGVTAIFGRKKMKK
jgi:hypothetical protein